MLVLHPLTFLPEGSQGLRLAVVGRVASVSLLAMLISEGKALLPANAAAKRLLHASLTARGHR
jgi:hypothetical protein